MTARQFVEWARRFSNFDGNVFLLREDGTLVPFKPEMLMVAVQVEAS